MAKVTEKSLDKTLTRKVKEAGGWCLKLEPVHVSGLPDRFVLMPGGRLIFVEVKGAGKKPTKLQTYVHKKLSALGFNVYILDNYEVINLILK